MTMVLITTIVEMVFIIAAVGDMSGKTAPHGFSHVGQPNELGNRDGRRESMQRLPSDCRLRRVQDRFSMNHHPRLAPPQLPRFP